MKLLNTIIIYKKDNCYFGYEGQLIQFDIVKSNGTKVQVIDFNTFFIINSTGYKTEYEPCENMNKFANSLLNSKANKVSKRNAMIP